MYYIIYRWRERPACEQTAYPTLEAAKRRVHDLRDSNCSPEIVKVETVQVGTVEARRENV